jgi:hypothetical protein
MREEIVITRRSFSHLCWAAFVTRVVHPPVIFGSDSQLTVNGDFGFKFQNGSLTMNVKDAKIDGLSIPAFSWRWVGLAIAQGLLAGFGGLIFKALSDAILGHDDGKSMEQLLKEQLAQFAQIVQDALMMNNLQQYQAKIDAYCRVYREFLNDRRLPQLDLLLFHSREALSLLATTGFSGYRTYMIGTGLRLAALRDQMRMRHTSSADFKEERAAALEFHKSVQNVILDQTNPTTVFKRFDNGRWTVLGRFRYQGIQNQKILSEPLNGT